MITEPGLLSENLKKIFKNSIIRSGIILKYQRKIKILRSGPVTESLGEISMVLLSRLNGTQLNFFYKRNYAENFVEFSLHVNKRNRMVKRVSWDIAMKTAKISLYN